MKTILFYLLQVIITSGIIYGYYHFFLRNKKFHGYNRYFLLAATAISISIPFLNIPVYFTRPEVQPSSLLQTLAVISSGKFEDFANGQGSVIQHRNQFSIDSIFLIVYTIIALAIISRFITALLKIKKLANTYPKEKIEEITFINTNEQGTPFSFLRLLFWNQKISLSSPDGEQIFRHELYHIHQKHSYDIIFIEILSAVFWFNPFFDLTRKELKTIHEFLADESAVIKNEEWAYAELLLMQVLGSPNNRLTNPFFHNQTKRRIAMITSSQKTTFQYLRKLLVLPVAVILVALFAFNYKAKTSTSPVSSNLFEKPITVIIDAGHGGQAGVKAVDGTYEGDIALALAKKVKELNKNDRIKIVLTRDSHDEVDLKKRSDFANSQNPDLFISIHLNNAPVSDNNRSGFDVFISKKNSTFNAENKILGTILLNYFSNIYPVEKKIQQQNEGIWVLDNSKCPSVLVECGYLSNKKDLAFIKESANQELVAQNILQSIEQYVVQKESPDFNKIKKQVSDTSQPEIKVIKGSDGKVSGTVDGMKIKGMSSTKRIDKYGDTTVAMAFFWGETNLTVIPKEKVELSVKKYGSLWNELMQSLPPTAMPSEIKDITPLNEKIFKEVEVDPAFPGGDNAWLTYLQKNLNANTPVDNKAPEGSYTVWVKFLVSKEGKVSEIKTLTNHGFGMEQEVAKLIKNGPDWKPGIQNGHKVNAYKKQPVTFVVKDENVTKSTSFAIESQNDIRQVKALAKGSHDVAYVFKGRTYLFANSEATNFTEMDGDKHPLMLNGQVIPSIGEMNKLVDRKDVKDVDFITKEEALRLYNINDYIATVRTR